jgi:predicted double-glycine peptidase
MKRVLLILIGLMAWHLPAAQAQMASLKEIREEGLILQEWDHSCAAAALATVLTYSFNDPITERQVAFGLLAHTTPETVRRQGGFSLLDMKKFADIRGYDASGFKGMDLATLQHLKAPILPIRQNGVNHFVVLRGVNVKGQVELADPAFGNRTMSYEKFEDIWIAGIAFTMKRTS